MAKFQCRHCGLIWHRDLRLKENKIHMTKRGFKSYCSETGKNTLLKQLK
jgi:hypothetical protein